MAYATLTASTAPASFVDAFTPAQLGTLSNVVEISSTSDKDIVLQILSSLSAEDLASEANQILIPAGSQLPVIRVIPCAKIRWKYASAVPTSGNVYINVWKSGR